jgi:hypothetical protein
MCTVLLAPRCISVKVREQHELQSHQLVSLGHPGIVLLQCHNFRRRTFPAAAPSDGADGCRHPPECPEQHCRGGRQSCGQHKRLSCRGTYHSDCAWCICEQVSTMFVPLAREGWLQKLVASPGHPFGQWRVLWVELLEDGKLSWFDSSRKRKSDFRQALHPKPTAR